MKLYDYTILGAGASGLMLAYRMANDAFYDDKSILIIDKDANKGNDRTWSFWETENGEWDSILEKSWKQVYFGSDTLQETIDISPYYYKMIKSKTLYDLFRATIRQKQNIAFVATSVKGFTENDTVDVETTKGIYKTKKLFNSIPNTAFLKQNKYPVLQQHFLGWFIKSKAPVFDDSKATFMDFSVAQKGNTRFMYVLPTDKHNALFEYTLFSKDLLEISEYENAIKAYLKDRNITDYEITEVEKGSIPMTSYKFTDANTNNVLHIGTAGGWTKASTGYTFMNTTKKTKALVSLLKQNQDLSKFHKISKFWFYDLIFMDVLANHNESGANLFSTLFKRANVKIIFKFLDEESSLLQDLKIICAVPPKHFIAAFFKRIFL